MKKYLLVLLVFSFAACSSSDKSLEPINEAEMMARAQELASPGDGHKKLEPLVGQWKATSRFWMDPSKAPQGSVASVSRKWILGGRFIREIYVDKNPKQPFEGIGLLGYDNVRKAYIWNWLDTMATGVSSSEGTASPDGDVISFVGHQACPITGAVLKTRSKISIIDMNKNIVELFQTNINGDENRVLEIVYKRQKG